MAGMRKRKARGPRLDWSARVVDTGVNAGLRTCPWSRRLGDGVYVGWDRSVWLYRQIPTWPLAWSDDDEQISVQRGLENILLEVGATAKDLGGGLRTFSRTRDFHLLAVTYSAAPIIPETTPRLLADTLEDILPPKVPERVLLIGVRLRPSLADAATSSAGLAGQTKAALAAVASLDTGEPADYQADLDLMAGVLARAGCRAPSDVALDQAESWFNSGNGPDVALAVAKDRVRVSGGSTLQISAAMTFQTTQASAPSFPWVQAALTGQDSADVVSIRGTLEPATVTRSQMRMATRRVLSQINEQAATGDLDRPEDSEALQVTRALESYLVGAGQPWCTDVSVLFAHRLNHRQGSDTYIDRLRNHYGVLVRPLDHRQREGLAEMMPAGSARGANPFLQEMNPATLAYSGAMAWSALGDTSGAVVGLGDPDGTMTYLDILGAPALDKTASMMVAGDSGSGKTFFCQQLTIQALQAQHNVIFINPKEHDSLVTLVDLAREYGVPGRVVRLTAIERDGGYFDPFGFCVDPVMAAEVLSGHIMTALAGSLSREDEIDLQDGLRRGAEAGARCAMDALSYVTDGRVRGLVEKLAAANSLFALGIGRTPRDPAEAGKGLTLIEFDRYLDLPDKAIDVKDHTSSQKVALAAIRLVVRSAMESLMLSHGGVLIVDEAWTFLNSADGVAALNRMSRLGRSLNILPVFATQRVADILGNDLTGYLSRVFALSLKDPAEAAAAIRLVGLEPTASRIELLKNAAPRRTEDGVLIRGALALHRDLYDRHGLVEIGAGLPASWLEAFTTNPLERAARAARAAARTNPTQAPANGGDAPTLTWGGQP